MKLTAEIHQEGIWFIAWCLEFPEANGQGLTRDEALISLREAVVLLLEDRREDSRAKLPADADLAELALA